MLKSNQQQRYARIYRMTVRALMAAFVVVLAFVPNIGYITFLPFVSPTTVHLPVIVGAILLGPADGAFLGLVFGITSVVQATLQGSVFNWNFAFSPFVPYGSYKSLIIAIVPRVMIGVVAALTFRLAMKLGGKKTAAGVVAALAGSLTNTVLVLGGLYVMLNGLILKLAKFPSPHRLFTYLLGLFVTNGLAEAALAAIVAGAVVYALEKAKLLDTLKAGKAQDLSR